MKHFFLFLCLGFSLASCRKDEPLLPTDYSEGVYVVNEGNFGTGNGSITWFNRTTKESIEIPFTEINGTPLGDVPNSMTVIGDKGYIVVNNSGKIEVVNLDDFSIDMTITACSSPRYVARASATSFLVTDWGTNSLMIFQNGNPVPTDTIPLGLGPEQIFANGDRIFIANSGGFGIDSTVSVVSLQTKTVIDTIVVGKAPMQIMMDNNAKVWVLCRGDYGNFGDPLDDIGGSIFRIDPILMQVDANFQLGQNDHPAKMVLNASGEDLYFVNGMIYTMNVEAFSLPTTPLISKYGYGVGVDPANGLIYVSDALDFSQRGWAYRYFPNGTLVDSFRTGIIPGEFNFN